MDRLDWAVMVRKILRVHKKEKVDIYFLDEYLPFFTIKALKNVKIRETKKEDNKNGCVSV